MKKTKKQLAKKLVKLKKIKKGEGVFLTDNWKKQKEEIQSRVKNRIKKVQEKEERLKTSEPVKSSKKIKKALTNIKKQEEKRLKRKKFLEKSNKLK